MYNDTDTNYNVVMKKIQTGQQSFRKLIETDSVYVDKTRYIKMLLDWDATFYFAARPRRFGKSLFCTTLEALFKGKKELFEGLYIYDKYDFKPYPVLHFSFNDLDAFSEEAFVQWLKDRIIEAAKREGITLDSDDVRKSDQHAICRKRACCHYC